MMAENNNGVSHAPHSAYIHSPKKRGCSCGSGKAYAAQTNVSQVDKALSASAIPSAYDPPHPQTVSLNVKGNRAASGMNQLASGSGRATTVRTDAPAPAPSVPARAVKHTNARSTGHVTAEPAVAASMLLGPMTSVAGQYAALRTSKPSVLAAAQEATTTQKALSYKRSSARGIAGYDVGVSQTDTRQAAVPEGMTKTQSSHLPAHKSARNMMVYSVSAETAPPVVEKPKATMVVEEAPVQPAASVTAAPDTQSRYAYLWQNKAMQVEEASGIIFGASTMSSGFSIEGYVIHILQPGTYHAVYMIALPPQAKVDTTFSLRVGDADLQDTVMEVKKSVTKMPYMAMRQAIFNLDGPAELILNTTQALDVAGDDEALVSLTIVKIP